MATIEDRAREQNPELKDMFDKIGKKMDGHGAGALGSVPNPVGSTNSHGAGVTIPEQYKTPAVQAEKAKQDEKKP